MTAVGLPIKKWPGVEASKSQSFTYEDILDIGHEFKTDSIWVIAVNNSAKVSFELFTMHFNSFEN